tara:strand:- start:329 stop:958 length:630 start_codon:yes stop_codon:yes gene_type:complete
MSYTEGLSNPEPIMFDHSAFIEVLKEKLEDKGIELTFDDTSVIYTHVKSGVRIVDFKNGIGPVGTILGMQSTFVQIGESLKQLIEVEISDNQMAALVSFASHIGIDNFGQSKVLTELNKGNYAAVPKLMQRWRTGKIGKTGKVQVRQDYVARRKYEGELFQTPDWVEFRSELAEMTQPAQGNFNLARSRLQTAKRQAFDKMAPGFNNPF